MNEQWTSTEPAGWYETAADTGEPAEEQGARAEAIARGIRTEYVNPVQAETARIYEDASRSLGEMAEEARRIAASQQDWQSKLRAINTARALIKDSVSMHVAACKHRDRSTGHVEAE